MKNRKYVSYKKFYSNLFHVSPLLEVNIRKELIAH